MEKFTTHEGLVAAIERANIDTDQIIPKQFLKKIGKTGFGKYLFFDWRFLPDGSVNPKFELNFPQYANASILLAGDNFGCGSSREHAPWALLDYGIRVIVSSSFAEIFFNNCYKNGILPIVVTKKVLATLFAEVKQNPGTKFKVDLENQTLQTTAGTLVIFTITARQKEFLVQGLDEVSWTLQFEEDIARFEERQKSRLPWLWGDNY